MAMGEMFRDWDAAKKVAKEERLTAAIDLNASGWVKHTVYHWSRCLCGDRMDYWPSTGKWLWRGRRYRGRPSDTLRFIANREKEAPDA